MKFDKLDEKIINSLTRNTKIPLRQLAKRLKVSFVTVMNRIKRLEKEGAEAIRLAVKDRSDAQLLTLLKKSISIPVVADIHFNYRLALASIEAGFDGVRLNPCNIYKHEQVREVVREAKKAKISLRVGVNSGGLEKKLLIIES